MKTLYLVRHAKSSWAMEGQPDIDRPLNERGYVDAHLVSKHLNKEKFRPDLIISSPAIRAITTALIFAENRYSKENILIKQGLYESGKDEYLECIHSTDNNFSNIMLFGHNPVISETAEYLLARQGEDMPTCSVISIEFKVDFWKKVAKNEGLMAFFITPGALKEQ